MRPLTHGGGLFDSLYISSFGFGGDPNDVARLRMEKGKWYNFVALYRRDENYFNFNLFANPLNLNQGIGNFGTSFIGANFDPRSMPWYANSPHLQNTTRNMGDFNLTLFPQSPVRIRLGYSRNVNAGRLDTTMEGTPSGSFRSLMTEYSQSRSDRYQFGIDIRLMPRTTFSFDQFYEHDKVDPNFVDGNLSFTAGSPNFAGTPAGTPIDLSLVLPPASCTSTPGVTFPGSNVFVSSSGCNIGLYSFNRSGKVRTNLPTSMVSLQSNYFRKLDITASGTYSSGHSDLLNYQEFSNFVNVVRSPTNLITGASHTDRVSGNADLGLTYHVSHHLSFSDKFRWLDWRNPGGTNQSGFSCAPAAPGPGVTPANANCVTANAANSVVVSTYIAERTYNNTAKLNWSSARFGAYVGYRYGRRELKGAVEGDSPALNSYYSVTDGTPDGVLNTSKINENTALGGITLRPTNQWRINADLELLYADNAFTNIGPRHQQRVRVNTRYKVNKWASVSGSVHFVETRNDFAESVNASNPEGLAVPNPNLFPTTGANTVPGAYGHKDHWRYYTFGASLNPSQMFGFDFGWTYLDQLINSATCVPSTGTTVQTTPAKCNGGPAGNAGGLPLILDYQERTNTGYAYLTFRPVHRVSLSAGYELTSTAGFNRWLLPGGSNGTGPLLVLGDIYGNAFATGTVDSNPITPCPAASTTVAGLGCAFAGPFPDAPLSQALNWHKPTLGIAIEVCKNVTLKGNYAYFDYNEKEPVGLPLVTLPRDFHANTGTVSLKYSF